MQIISLVDSSTICTKSHANGGFNLSRISSSSIIAALMLAGILLSPLIPQKRGVIPG